MDKYVRRIKFYIKKHKATSLIVIGLLIFAIVFAVKQSSKENIYIPLSEAVRLSQENIIKEVAVKPTGSDWVNNLSLTIYDDVDFQVKDINGMYVNLIGGEIIYASAGTLNLNDLADIGFILPSVYSEDKASMDWSSLISSGLMLLMLLAVVLWVGRGSFFSSGTKFEKSNEIIRFSDIGGIKEVKESLMDVVYFLKHRDAFEAMGARVPRGILLEGMPGTGKTMLAQAVANEANVPFYFATGSEFHNMWVGMAALRVKQLFKKANKTPSVIFIDEFDSIATKRTMAGTDAGREWNHTLNQLLAEMDGFKKNSRVIVLAATNRADVLDSAVLRAGRFDRKIMIPLPNYDARCEILKIHSKGKNLENTTSIEVIAKQTSGLSGADLALLLNESAIQATKEKSSIITKSHMARALDKVLVGDERKGFSITDEERSMLAYHEAGHAVVASFIPNGDKVQRITILPHGFSGGFTRLSQEKETLVLSKSKAISSIAILLGGRIAEQTVINDVTSASQDDIRRANELAREMVEHYGMSEHYGLRYVTRNEMGINNASSEIMSLIESDIKDILEQASKMAENILEKHRVELDRIADKLIEVETLDSDDIKKLVDG